MIFFDIHKYMKAQGRASLDDLVLKFDADQTAIEGMMETLKDQGQVIEEGCGSCGSSRGCSFVGPRIYVFVKGGGSQKRDHLAPDCNRLL